MKRFLEALGFFMVLVGLAGVVRHFVGGFKLWAFLSHIDLFKEHEIAANLGLIALGAAIMIVTTRRPALFLTHDRAHRRDDGPAPGLLTRARSPQIRGPIRGLELFRGPSSHAKGGAR